MTRFRPHGCRVPTLGSTLLVLLSLLLTLDARAQAAAADSAGPRRGTWGAEATASSRGGGATLLRFVSPRRAWVFGIDATGGVRRERRQNPNPFLAPDEVETTTGFVQVGLRLGSRWYGAPGQRVRPVVGVAGTGSYNWDRDRGRVWSAGVLGEWGAVCFFGPHTSLGATGEARVHYDDQQIGLTRMRGVAADALVARFLAAVYF